MDVVEDERMQGYRIAMIDAGLPVRVEEFASAPKVVEEHLLRLLGRRPAPTALLCKSDHAAKEVAKEVQDLGYRVPEDVSVMGFGGEKHAFAKGRRLGTVWLDAAGMGRTAARFLLDELKGEMDRPQRCMLPGKITPYDSVAKAPTVRAAASTE